MSKYNLVKRIRADERKIIENENKINNLEKKFNSYKRYNEKILKSYNEQFNMLFLFTDIEPKGLLKANHQLNLELLSFVDNICKKYDLEFWLDYGALLGAIRHNGFIPWDDDVDMSMMRKDYDKFFEVLPKEIKDNNLDDNLSVRCNISEVKPVPCIQILYNKNVPGLLAGIDITAYDFMDKQIDLETYKKMQDEIRNKNMDGIPIYDAVKEYLEEYNIGYEKQKYVMPGAEGFYEVFSLYHFFMAEYDQLFPLKKATFEGRTFNVPNDYNYFLNKIYGEYLNVPRKIHTHYHRWESLRELEDGLEIYMEQVEKFKKINEEFK